MKKIFGIPAVPFVAFIVVAVALAGVLWIPGPNLPLQEKTAAYQFRTLAACYDSDGGVNVSIFGNCTDSIGLYNDTCNGDAMTEYACDTVNDTCVPVNLTCIFGCSNGACGPTPTPFCSDTDNGFNAYVKGTCSSVGGNATDYCDGNTLRENYCTPDNWCVDDWVTCPGRCTDGECNCYDSDDGDNLSVQGTCSDLTGTYSETCSDSLQVNEYQCTGTFVNGSRVTKCIATSTHCELGDLCINGSCVDYEDTCEIAGGRCALNTPGCYANESEHTDKGCPYRGEICCMHTHLACRSHVCSVVDGVGADDCSTIGARCGGGGGDGGCDEDWKTIQDWKPTICPITKIQTHIIQDDHDCGDKPSEGCSTWYSSNSTCVQTRPCAYFCTENWTCSAWSDCTSEGKQYRTCSDLNNCGTSISKPAIIEDCTVPPKTCAELTGIICATDEKCEGQTVSAADSEYCCIGNCGISGSVLIRKTSTWIAIGLGVLIIVLILVLLLKRAPRRRITGAPKTGAKVKETEIPAVLTEYIGEARKQKVSDKEIKTKLLDYGWDKKLVDLAMKSKKV
jgi:hypothetical protein